MTRQRIISVYCFVVGLVGALCSLVWMGLASRDVLVAPEGPIQALLAFAPYIVAASWTLDRRRADWWVPLFQATPARLLVARLVLAAGVLASCILLIEAALVRQNRELVEMRWPWVLGTMAFTHFAYMTAHWALHPRKVLGPFAFLVRPIDRRLLRGTLRSPARLRSRKG